MFSFGLVAGGAFAASILWLMTGLFRWEGSDFGLYAVIAIGVLGLARDMKLVNIPLPQTKRQVPRSIFDNGWRRASLVFGFEMGTGLRTYVSASAPYLVAAGILFLVPTFGAALATGVGFGLGRALMPVTRGLHSSPLDWDAGWDRVEVPIKAALLVTVLVGLLSSGYDLR